MGITKFVLKKPVTTILAVLCLIIFGYQSITTATLELTPETEMPMMIVSTIYPGASPEDVNELISKPIEEAVSTLSGIDKVTVTSSEQSSIVMIQYDYEADIDDAYDELKKAIDTVERELPEDANTPAVLEINMNSSADISMVVENSKVDNISSYVDSEIIPELEKISTAAEVNVTGSETEYIQIELIEEMVNQYGLTMASISNDIAAANIAYPAGEASMGSQDLSVSTRMNFDTVELLKEIPLTTKTGGTIYLQDVANIVLTVEEVESIARYNGNQTVSIGITKQQSVTSMDLSEDVIEIIDAMMREDENLNITVVNDKADSILESILSVVETLFLAIVIAMIIIWLFFGDIKASLIVGSAIPISIFTSLIAMNLMDVSLNIITLCALTLGVGMMVDNSIVVLESCFRVSADNQKKGIIEYTKHALEGTGIVASSVVASTVTTCVVFIPLMFLSGMSGQMFGPLGFTIVVCMVASLVSSLTVVPLSYLLWKPVEKEKAPLSKTIENIQDGYRKLMRFMLPKKKTVMLTSIILLVFSFFLATKLRVELMPTDDLGEISLTIDTRPGMEIEKVDEILLEIEELIVSHPDVDNYITKNGSSGVRGGTSSTIDIYLKSDREMETSEVIDFWKLEMQEFANCQITVEENSSMSAMQAETNFSTIIRGSDYDEIKETSDAIVADLMKREEVTRVHSDAENAAPVIEVEVDAVKAKAYGLNAATIGSYLNQHLSGVEATELEVDGENIEVKVEYPEGSYETLDEVMGITIPTQSGSFVLLTDVANVGFEDSPATIRRENKEYIITIEAEYTEAAVGNTKMALTNEVVKPHLTETITTGTNAIDQMMNDEFMALGTALVTAVFLVFVVMAAQFESPKFSIMVMLTIPFSLIGSFGLMWLLDSEISMISLVGFLMLVGTVVNAGILYVDTVNQYRETMDRDVALIEAGATRLRPILMTTLTTVISMIPMAMELGSSGAMTKGLAVVNIGGIAASTCLSLIMLPVFYSIISKNPKDIEKKKMKKWFNKRKVKEEQ